MTLHCDWEAANRDFLMEHAALGDPWAAEILRGLLLLEHASDPQAAGSVIRVAVGVCTSMRPRMLAHCLEAICAQILAQGSQVHVVVVDNEPEANSRGIVEDFACRCPFAVHYVHEPRRGIPHARNAVLERCSGLDVDWIAFTDDDCWVSPAWLTSLVAAARRHQASVIYGRRKFVFSCPSAFWATRPLQRGYLDGQELPYASTHNVLLAAHLIQDGSLTGLRFDERLTHGEDTDFFHRARQRGERIVYSHAPVVLETVIPERATLIYHVRRAFHTGASRSRFHRRYRGFAGAVQELAARFLLQAPAALVRLLTAPIVWPFSEPAFKLLILKGAGRLAATAGAAAGLLGLDCNPYETIDGY